MRFTDEDKERIWDMHQAGVPVKRIARIMGRQNVSLRGTTERSFLCASSGDAARSTRPNHL
jgi:transposase-like protein